MVKMILAAVVAGAFLISMPVRAEDKGDKTEKTEKGKKEKTEKKEAGKKEGGGGC